MAATNKSPWIKNIFGAGQPLIFMGAVQAGTTAPIKRGEICTYNETTGYFIPATASTDAIYSLAIANEEQKAADLAGYMEFIALREGDVFEFLLASARAVTLGDPLALTSADSQKLTYDADGVAVATVVSSSHYPEHGAGTTIRSQTYAQVMFRRQYSYLYKNIMRSEGQKVIRTATSLTLLPEDCGACVLVSNTATITMPNAVVPDGWWVEIVAIAAVVVTIDPKPDTASIVIKGAVHTAGNTISFTDEGDFVKLLWDNVNQYWVAVNSISGADGDITLT